MLLPGAIQSSAEVASGAFKGLVSPSAFMAQANADTRVLGMQEGAIRGTGVESGAVHVTGMAPGAAGIQQGGIVGVETNGVTGMQSGAVQLLGVAPNAVRADTKITLSSDTLLMMLIALTAIFLGAIAVVIRDVPMHLPYPWACLGLFFVLIAFGVMQHLRMQQQRQIREARMLVESRSEMTQTKINADFNTKIDTLATNIRADYNTKIDALYTIIRRDCNTQIKDLATNIQRDYNTTIEDLATNIQRDYNRKIEALTTDFKGLQDHYKTKIRTLEIDIRADYNTQIERLKDHYNTKIEALATKLLGFEKFPFLRGR
eukprot:GHVN01049239.1.p1 GENE.GHVN01049239.1~~GHVN01049239.1.p1  ORF type:complete len:317 (+),score=11.46 GHVN01049239.1:100-1050(+)